MNNYIQLGLRHLMMMDEENTTRQTRASIAPTDANERDWSESTHTYYYSKFQLFEHTQEINQFYRYSLFLGKVSTDLGQEWKQQAKFLFHPAFGSEDIFMQLLAIWLHVHPSLNNLQQNPFMKTNTPVFNQSFTDEFLVRVKNIHKERFSGAEDLKINNTSVRAICMGFFLTANETWQEMFKKEQKTEKKVFSLFQGMNQKIQQSFHPLMVVTQKISNLFGRKKIKRSEPVPSNISMNSQVEKMFGDCYMEFRRTIDIEKQLERKMSDVCLEDEQQGKQDKKMIVTKNQFKDEESPVEKNMLGSMYEYISKFLKRKHSWQVASSFVTNILDINHEESMNEGTRIKVLRPAEDFYSKLVITWLMFKRSNESQELQFGNFLVQVKVAFGWSWREKYCIPTKYFYQKLIKYWEEIKGQSTKTNEKQILGHLITKIRQSMREDWERKIKIEGKEKN